MKNQVVGQLSLFAAMHGIIWKVLTALSLFLPAATDAIAQYCNASFSNCSYESITNVNFAGINNSSGCGNGLNDYRNRQANVNPGETYSLSISIVPDADDYLYVFIDWNQNGGLDDAGEVYIVASRTSDAGPHELDIVVPDNAAVGETRMRVMLDWNNDTPNPCRRSNYGEVEDYTVVVSGTPLACPRPADFRATDVGFSSVDLAWTGAGDATDLKWGLAGFDVEDEGTLVTGITETTQRINGLTADVAYHAYVRADCGAEGYSHWAGPVSFTPGYRYSTSDIPTMYVYNPGVGSNFCEPEPTITIQVPTGYQLAGMTVKYDMTARNDAWMSEQRSMLYSPSLAVGEEGVTPGEGQTGGTYHYSRPISFADGATGDVTFVLRTWRTWDGGGGGAPCNTHYNFVPNGSWQLIPVFEALPSCPNPAGLAVSSISRYGATVSWGGSSTPDEGYAYYYSKINTPPDAHTTPSGNTAYATVDLSGLDMAETYYFWVRANCGNGDYGNWVGTSFMTAKPWTEKFSTPFNLPDGWTVVSGYWDVGTTMNLPGSDGHVAYRLMTSGDFYVQGSMSTPDIPGIENGDILSFAYRKGHYAPPYDAPPAGSGNMVVAISADGGESFVEVETVPNNGTSGWQTYTLDLSAYAGQTIRVRITANRTGSEYYIGFDNFYIGPPICHQVFNLETSAITTTSATISWSASASSPVAGYEYFYATDNTPPNAITGALGTAATTSADLNGLSPGVMYYYWVRPDCGGAYAEWSPGGTFGTELEIAGPWYEHFSATPLPGWDTPLWTVGTGADIPNSDGAVVYTQLFNNASFWTRTITTPTIIHIAQGDELSFNYALRASDNPAGVPPANSGNFTVALSTDYGETYSTIATVVNDGLPGWKRFSYLLGDYEGQRVKVRITANHNSSSYYIGFDNFAIAPVAGCPPVSALVVSATTPTSATVSWEELDAVEQYDYYYAIDGTPPGSDTPPSGNTADAHVKLDNLEAGKTYFIWVRAVCAGLEGDWSPVQVFTTSHIVPAPYAVDFSTVPIGWETGGWTASGWPRTGGGNGNVLYKNLYGSVPTAHFTSLIIEEIKAGYQLSFTYQAQNFHDPYGPAATGSGNFVVSVSADFGATYQTLITVPNNGVSGWQEFNYPLDDYVGESIQVRILTTRFAGDYYIGFDDFYIGKHHNCGIITDPVALNVATNSLTIGWTPPEGDPVVKYDYYYATNNNEPAADQVSGSTETAQVQLDGLISGQTYYFWVRTDCGNGDYSTWSSARAYTTGTIRYVREGASGNGTTWANASGNLQTMINASGAGDEVWVAAGTYMQPTNTGMPPRGFELKSGVAVYGGFPAGGGDWVQRNWRTNSTILKRNPAHELPVVDNYDVDATAVLDGFVITEGHAPYGGGMRNRHSSPLLRNLEITNNRATWGGGLYNDGASPTLVNVAITNNHSQYYIGGVYNGEYMGVRAAPVFTNVLIARNTVGNGYHSAAMYNENADVTLTNVTIAGNQSETTQAYVSTTGNPTRQTVDVYNQNSVMRIRNSIIHSNSNGVYSDANSTLSVSHSLIQGLTAADGNGNIDGSTNPGFMHANRGDYRLLASSPVINAGNDGYFASGSTPDLSLIADDLKGNPRFYEGSTVDLGAYEYNSDQPPLPITVRYVKTATNGGAPGNNGLTWETASSNLQAMIDASLEGDEVWVAAGDYHAVYYEQPHITFVLKDGVAVYGGFPANGGTMNQRDWKVNGTTLVGYSGGDYPVITNYDITDRTILNGFIIRGGQTDRGGGIHNSNSSPILKNLWIRNNQATWGGGIYNENGSSPEITDVEISDNIVQYSGGGLLNTGNSNPILTRVVIRENKVTASPIPGGIAGGGGIFHQGGGILQLTAVTVVDNTSNSDAGGIHLADESSASRLENSRILGNTAQRNGGGVYLHSASSTATLVNTVIGDNEAQRGGGVYNDGNLILLNTTLGANKAAFGGGVYHARATAAAAIENSIISGNYRVDGTTPDNVYDNGSGGSVRKYASSLVSGSGGSGSSWGDNLGMDGGGNLDGEADFLSTVQSSTDFLRLGGCSPAIDGGNNQLYGNRGYDLVLDTDVDGNPRLYADRIDMGAHERQLRPSNGVVGPEESPYAIGRHLDFEVTFAEAVAVAGVPYLSLTIGEAVVEGRFVPAESSATKLIFRYQVAEGDEAEDGVEVGSAIVLNDGQIAYVNGGAVAELALCDVALERIQVDGIRPILIAVSIASDNERSNAMAKLGTVVSVTFTASEAIGTPDVTIAGTSVTVSLVDDGVENTWRASYTLTEDDEEGEIFFSIGFADLVGNGGTVVTETMDGSTVTIDKTAPVVTGVTDGGSYHTGVTITFNEGTATLNGDAFISDTEITGEDGYTLVVTDAAGNVTTVNFTIYVAIDKSGLQSAIDETESLTATDYSEASWSVVESALAVGQDVYDNEDATQSEIDAAEQALRDAMDALTVDRTGLASAIMEAKDLTASDYSEASWSVVESALVAAQDVYADNDVTQSEIDAAEQTLRDALDNLTVDKTDLASAIAEAEGLTATDYSEASWSVVEIALASAKDVYADNDAIQSEIDAAEQALRDALANLTVDRTGLQSAITETNGLTEAYYAPASWAAVETALEVAETVYNDPNATQSQIDAAEQALRDAMANLTVDGTGLASAIEEANGLNEVDYAPASWAAVEAALEAAEAVYSDPNATQAQIDTAEQALRDALAALTVDRTGLQSAITETNGLTEAYYAPASWAAVETALEVAEAVYSDPNATQAQIDAAEQALRDAMNALTVDRTGLQSVITEANGLTEADYAPASWEAVEAAMEAAEAIYNDPNATQIQIDTAEQALRDAMAGLTVDRTGLASVIDEAEGLTATDYSEASWSEVESALVAAQDVFDDNDATQSEIDAAEQALRDALANLTVDKTGLQSAIAETNGLNATDYAPASWEAVEAAMEAAEVVYNNPNATQAQIDAAEQALRDALNALTVERTGLASAIAEAEGLTATDYSEASWSEVESALVAAQDVFDDNDATQSEIDAAEQALRDALANLTVDKTGLQSAIAETNGLNATDYAPASWAAVEAALETAQMVYNDPNATQAQIDAAEQALRDAMNVLAVDRTGLQSAIAEAEGLTATDYSEVSWSVVETALVAAQDVFDDNDATQSEIDAAGQALRDAMNALTVDRTGLQSAIADANGLTEADYAPASWQAVETALAAAETVYNNPNATQAQIDAAEQALRDAMNALTVDRTGLQSVITEANGLTEADYAPASWEAVEAAMEAVEAIYNDPNATQIQIDTAEQALRDAMAGLTVDRTGLASVIDEAEGLTATDYSEASWSEVESALVAAQDVFDDNDATQSEIDAAEQALRDALANLTVDKTGLQSAIAETNGLNATDYAPASWEAVEAAMEAAEVVYNNPNATQAQIDAAEQALRDALAGLTVDRTGLQSAITETNGLTEAYYAPASWAAVETALEVAETVYNDPNATQSQIDAAEQALRDAMANLTVDRTGLQSVITEANGLTETEYAPASWAAIEAALEAAEAVYSDPNATQAQIDTAEQALRDALAALTVDRTGLQSAITETNGLTEADYAPASWAAVETALEVAETVYNDPNATQSEVDAAEQALRDAMNALTVERTGLASAIAEAEGLTATDYSEASWSEVESALAAAQDVFADNDATQSEIDTAEQALRDAMNALTVERTGLASAIAEAEGLTATDYSETSWSEVESALAAAQDVFADNDATQSEIDAAEQALRDALDNLTVDKTDLASAIAEAEGLTATDYSEASWEAVEAALAAAETVYNNPNATQSEVDAAEQALRDALDNLTVDKTDLASAIAEAEGLTATDYSEASWSVVEIALTSAKDVYADNDAIQSEIDAAEQALRDALANLTVDRTGLQSAITETNGLTEAYYAPASWAAVETALEVAETVYNDPNATQSQIDAAEQALRDAMANLTVDRTGLQSAIEEANGLTEADYAQASWEAVETALAAAETVYNNPNATQVQIDAAEQALRDAINALTVDRTGLQSAITEANGLTESDYAPASWAAIEAALEAAGAVYSDPNATQAQIDTAEQALRDALAALTVDRTGLQSAITETNGLTEAYYAPASWTAVETALEVAETAYNDPNATQAQIDAAEQALRDALAGLTVDRTGLQSAIAEANGLNEADYAPASWAVVETALASAETVYNNPNATQAQIDAAEQALRDAMNALTVDRTGLQSAIAEANGLTEADYAPASWEAVESALEAAEAVYSDPNATQAQIDAAEQALRDAMNALTVDRSGLQSAIAEAEGLTESDYAPASWEAVEMALDVAEAVYNDPNATQAQIDAAEQALRDALNALTIDRTGLQSAIAEANGLTESDYAPASWAAVETALEVAETAYNNPNTTQAQIDAAEQALRDGMNALTVDRTGLQSAITEAEGLTESDYAPASWRIVETALEAAEAVYNNPNATQAQIDAAEQALRDAMNALTVDRTGLQSAIAEAEGLTATDYSEASWAAVETALAAAEAVYDNLDATQSEIDAAEQELRDAMNALTVDRTGLASAMEEAEGLTASDYSEASWAAVETALAAAEAVYDNLDATQSEIDAAEQELRDAMNALTVDRAGLASAIEEANGLTESDYAPASWAAVETALEAAEAVYSDPNATQAQIDTAEQALRDAMNALTVDRTGLQSAIAEAEGLTATDYSEVSWSVVETALAAAQDVYADNDAIQSEIDAAEQALRDALANLTVDKSDLASAIAEAEGLTATDYSEASWAAVETALAAAEAVYNNPNATQAQIDAAEQALRDAMNALTVDRTGLQSAIAEAKDLTATDYSEASWAVVESALAAAQNVHDDEDATQSEIDAAEQALRDAMANLTVDRTGLALAIMEANGLNEVDYALASWTAVETALESAEAVYNNPNATQAQIDAAEQALRDAMAALTVDKSGLQSAITEANGLNEGDYAPASWEPVEAALEAAEAVYNNPNATQSEIDAAEQALRDALNALAVDRTGLQSAIEEANGLNEADYAPASWGIVETALEAAETVYNNPNATQSEIDAAEQALRDAMNALAVDRTGQQSAIEEANGLNEADYAPASWGIVETALETAETVYNDPNATQAQIDTAEQALRDAMNALTVDRTGLQSAIEEANGLNATDYAPASWAAVETALAAAETVYNNPNARQSEIDAAEQALRDAMNALTVDRTGLQSAIEEANGLNEADYAPASWEAVESALEAAEAVYSDPNATQAQIDAAEQALRDALAGLNAGDTLAAPRNVQAAAGEGEVTLSWTAPQNNGGAPITDYLIEYTTDNGVTWLTYDDGLSAGTTTVVNGLRNNMLYRFRVAAVNAAGRGASSTPTDPIILTVPIPDQSGELPDPEPGETYVVVDGQRRPVTLEVIDDSYLRLSGDGFAMDLASIGINGQNIPITDIGAVIRIIRGQGAAVQVSGYGFEPGTVINLYIFSDPRHLGHIPVKTDGTFDGTLAIPADLEPGRHTLQANGVVRGTLEERSVSVGVLVVEALEQEITFGSLPAKRYGDAAFALNATADSGLPVSYRITDAAGNPTGIATIANGNQVRIHGAGTVRVVASQSGGGNYGAAEDVARTLVIQPADLSVAVRAVSRPYGEANPAFELHYAGFVNGDTERALVQVPVASTMATPTSDVGRYPILVSGGGSPNYVFTYESNTLTINKATQTITVPAITELDREAGSVPLAVSSSSGLPVTLEVDDQQVAVLGGGMLNVLRLGTVTITATQEGNANYHAADPVRFTIRITDDSNFPVKVHRAVSPNGDGLNEFLMVEGIRDFPENRVTVINRNGTVLYEVSGYDNGYRAFRGISTGQQQLPAGTYYYIVEIKENGRWRSQQGYFVLRY